MLCLLDIISVFTMINATLLSRQLLRTGYIPSYTEFRAASWLARNLDIDQMIKAMQEAVHDVPDSQLAAPHVERRSDDQHNVGDDGKFGVNESFERCMNNARGTC